MNKKSLLALGLVLTVSTGCSLLKKKKTAEEEESVQNAPTVTVNGTGAKNEKDVLRYANETAMSDVPATIGKDGVKAKTFPQSGADVATLAKGAAVVQKAKFFSTGVLVLFDDPTTNDGTKLLGWVEPSQLATGDADAAVAATATVAIPVALGTGPKLTVDAGKPADGGVVAVGADAGATADAGTAAVDAGVAAPKAFAGPLTIAAVNGTTCKNPVYQVVDKAAKACRHQCSASPDCPAGSICADIAGATHKACK